MLKWTHRAWTNSCKYNQAGSVSLNGFRVMITLTFRKVILEVIFSQGVELKGGNRNGMLVYHKWEKFCEGLKIASSLIVRQIKLQYINRHYSRETKT